MSEYTANRHERGAETNLDTQEIRDRKQELLEKAKHEAEKSRNEHESNIDDIRKEIEKNSTEAKEASVAEATNSEGPAVTNTYWNSREYREIAFQQLLAKVRKNLSGPEQSMSKFIHKPAVEKASEIGSKTVARPSGVLMGSIFSFIISLVTYFVAKRYSYDMSYGVFIASFVGGFILGVAIEFGYKTVKAILSRR